MKKDLRSMANKNRGSGGSGTKKSNSDLSAGNVSIDDLPPGAYDAFMRQKKQFEGMNEGELMHELLSRADGIKPEELENFRSSAQNMLSAQQRQKLDQIIRRLKR